MIVEGIITIIGLALFEAISSIDNAIVNASVLKTLPEKYKKFFLTWGLFLAVFVIRGALPFLLISSVNESAPLLLLGGGVYLFLVFLGWLFMEEKKYAFLVEGFLHRQAIWFYAISSLFITAVIYFSITEHPILALAASVGATAFFITDGFRKNAEESEKKFLKPTASALSKILFLEVLDASFSIDGVIGAFAFTLSLPLIIIGNGLGAYIVREFTIRGMTSLTKYSYLKNGAMYSIGLLGAIMVLEAFHVEVPFWVAPFNTFLLLGFFLFLSIREIRQAEELKGSKIASRRRM